MQTAFIAALSPEHLAKGWHAISFGESNGPMAAVVATFGLTWLTIILYTDAILGPMGGGLVSTASTARLTMAISQNGRFPPSFELLSKHGVPLRALILNFIIGLIVFLPIASWKEVITLNTGAIVLSFCMGPISVYALRAQLPKWDRAFRLPMVGLASRAAFIVVCWIIYWTGWDTIWRLSLPILLGVAIFAFRVTRSPEYRQDLDFREATWLIPYFGGSALLAYLGGFGNGIGLIPFGWDLLVVALFALAVFQFAFACRLTPEKVRHYLDEEASIERSEYEAD